MSERKLKCTQCGKWFKAADYRHTLCPACTAAERAKRAASTPAPPRPSPVTPKVPAVPPEVPVAVPPVTLPAPPVSTAPSAEAVPASTAIAVPSGDTAASAPEGRAAARRPAELSAEQRQAVEARYLELATPHEFDGIRSQIAEELHLPKALVKRAVNELRLRLGRPSWWDEQRAPLAPEAIDAVRQRYVAFLTDDSLPPVGIHRQLAEELGLTSLQVYRAIGQIRTAMGLPRFNERPEAVEEPQTAQVS